MASIHTRAGAEAPPAGMRIEHDVPITMEDGLVLRADVFRPDDAGVHPVIMTHGAYAKELSWQEGFSYMWQTFAREHPEALEGSSNRYQVWETVDPEKWVPDGYACVRVDSRGAGRSPGYLDVFSAQEIRDFAACIEWAGTEPWSNGKVGLLGISYYAMSQWLVAAQKPRHLAAICPWEGASDYYRDVARHGGIANTFLTSWAPQQVFRVQHGLGERGFRDRNTGEPVSGPETLSEDELRASRADLTTQVREHRLFDDFYRERTADPAQIDVPLLSAANWAHHLHTRANFEAYLAAGSQQKWLEVHGLEHWTLFFTEYGLDLQKRFFGHFLHGHDNGWLDQPPVTLNIRHADGTFVRRGEQEWPLARTQWTKLYLDPHQLTLGEAATGRPGSRSFDALGDGLTFTTTPFAAETEITGPLAARLHVSSTTADADLFLTLRVLDPDGVDVTFVSAMDPRGVPGFGWLRASHRKLDLERTLPYRPYHAHDELQPLTPGDVVPLDVEIWPTSVVLPPGYRLALTVQGKDFELPGDGPWPTFNGIEMRGNGCFVHRDPVDRPADVYAGTTTLVSAPERPCYLVVPVIPG
jgi:predicted acyl esterase